MRKIYNFLKKIWGPQTGGKRTLIMGLVITAVLLFIPTGYEDAVIYQGTDRLKATVIETDNSTIVKAGLIQTGDQVCTIRLEEGKFKGTITKASNLLSGSMAQDKIFSLNDEAYVVVSYDGESIKSVTMIDHFRLGWETVLAGIFCLLLVLYAGPGGLRALLSFVITVLSIWKIMIPVSLNGGNPIVIGLGIVAVLTVIIIVFVYGFDKRSLVATMGSMLGVFTACILGIIFTNALKIHGAIMTNSESLLYAGYQSLNLTRIFMASVFIGASGAMMDLSVDITSGIYEVIQKKPDISAFEAMGSGMRIGQAAMGTMTTTLLLAYSGSCITQMMTFMAQGTPILNILNYKYIAAEILQTLAGSFGLVTVAPFTAIVAGLLLTKKYKI